MTQPRSSVPLFASITRSVALAAGLLCLAAAGDAAQSGISADVEAAIALAAPGERIPVIIVMAEQIEPERLLPAVAQLTPAQRRLVATDELKLRANQSQAEVRDYLAAGQAAGEVANVRHLWIANGILGELTPDAIYGLLAFDEVRTVLWDPPIPAEEANDVEVSPEGNPASAGAELWQLENINAPDVWALGFEGAGILVAVQDSGIDRNHSDLAARMWVNPGEIDGNGIDDDANGYIDDIWGWDFESNDNNPSPGGSHGHSCAGIAVGDGTGGTRTGVAPSASVMACKVNTWGQNIEGIEYAIDNGAHIITMSRSQKWRFSPKPDYDWWRSITDGELLTGILHANSIGNEGDNQGTDPVPFNIAAPGSCPTPWRHPDQVQAGVSGITSGCGALDENDVIANYSSIGPFAWEDISVNWPSYPYPMRPEYQDYPYSGGLPGLLKPDVVAPGPGTTTTAVGFGYTSFGGTSAATPHVAGAMALILSANPLLTPADVTMILQTTAHDLGAPGKDNVYGAGRLDCLAAVQLALQMSNFGTLSGTVTDASTSDPIGGAMVEVLDTAFTTQTAADGTYSVFVAEGDIEVRFSDFYYEEVTLNANITAGNTTTLDAQLVPLALGDLSGTVTNFYTGTAIEDCELTLVDTPVSPQLSGADGSYAFNGIPARTYTLDAERFGFAPKSIAATVSATETVVDIELVPAHIALDMETDPGWLTTSTATTGHWVLDDPNGTSAQPEDDHTRDPGVDCWFTGQGTPGGSVGEADVDNGSVTLITAPLDLSATADPVITYWAWYSNNQGSVVDDEWVVDMSNDGVNWVNVVTRSASTSGWELFEHRVADYVTISEAVLVRFVATDTGSGSIVEAAVDDFQVHDNPQPAGLSGAQDAPLGPRVALMPNRPNPFNPTTSIAFVVREAGPARLAVYDVHGRHVRTLVDAPRLEGGNHTVTWDGRNDHGKSQASGVYYYKLEAAGRHITRSMVLMK